MLPITPANMCAMPTAKVGAPPVRPTIVISPTDAARSRIWSAVTGKPRAVTCCVTVAMSPFMLIAKYCPGSSVAAAIKAMMPTIISVIIPP